MDRGIFAQTFKSEPRVRPWGTVGVPIRLWDLEHEHDYNSATLNTR